MVQKSDLTAPARNYFPFLIAILASALSGCASIQTGSGLRHTFTGGYRGHETLAVLLPQSGRFAGAAQIVRDGIVAAREADPQGMRPALRFYDSASGSVTKLVRQAAADGATLVIGPLQKPAVDTLASGPALPIPVLALNKGTASGAPPKNLYQFALSPEDEASEVANKAWDAGHRTVLMLYPEGSWGNRISKAFRQRWKALGGVLPVTRAYDSSAADFSGTIGALSERAQGVDFVFLVATSKVARRIWPQIRQKIGTEIPVYTTSHIYSGHFDPEGDRGLVGLNFVEIPWLVEPTGGDAVSSKGLHKKSPRLYAMGVDAYRLGSRLDWMSRNPQERVQGKTGILGMDSQGRIFRELVLARFDATGPVRTAAIHRAEPEILVRIEPLSRLGPRLTTVGFPHLASIRN